VGFTGTCDMTRDSVQVLVVGSQQPEFEGMALAYGAREVVVSEYQLPPSTIPRVRYVLTPDLTASGETFDAVISISSVEHDGLGRYGDPLNPRADLDSMHTLLTRHMNPGGLLFLAVPVGRDRVVFNLHRVYGCVVGTWGT
jgi:hypothetical protein